MSESIESLRRSSIEVTDIKVEDITPDPVNPNTVPDEVMKALEADILERGYVQPVLVRPHDGKYRIIDGEHRWRVLKDAGAQTISCIIDDAGEDSARLRLISMNNLVGEFEPTKLADVMANLAKTMPEDELRARLGMDEDEYKAVRDLEAAGSDIDERLTGALLNEEQNAPQVMTWRFAPEDADTVDEAIQIHLENGAGSRAEALIALLES